MFSQLSFTRRKKIKAGDSLTWTEKCRPKVPNDIIGNQSLSAGKRQSESAAKKAVLISGSPGIGKSTSAKLVSQMLGFNVIEVNASDNRGKADAKIGKGVGGSTSNSIKELIGNKALSINNNWSKYPKTVLIMDEVDGMSAGDRGGVADLIASIKVSKIPIICICNNRYSQKLKTLVNYCMLLNYRKPTKQQMAKRLMQIAQAEGLQVNEFNYMGYQITSKCLSMASVKSSRSQEAYMLSRMESQYGHVTFTSLKYIGTETMIELKGCLGEILYQR